MTDANEITPPADEGRLERRVGPLAELVAHLLAEADFNRSWADGRRGTYVSAEYAAHRRAYAEKLERWAAEVEGARSLACDCTTATSPDGTKRTYCASAQMRRAAFEGHAFTDKRPNALPITGWPARASPS